MADKHYQERKKRCGEMSNKITTLISVCLLLGLGLVSTGGFAAHLGCPDPSSTDPGFNGCSLPGLREGTFPYFDQGVRAKYKARKDGDFYLKAKFDKHSDRSSLVIDPNGIFGISPDGIFDIDKTKFKIKVKVEDGVANGSLRIKGAIDEFGIKKTTLVTANLSGEWALSDDGQLIGFNTTNIVCSPELPINCTNSESIYLVLDDAINTGNKNYKTTGVAITTVPLPAAAWLFASGLLGLAGIARRRRSGMVSI